MGAERASRVCATPQHDQQHDLFGRSRLPDAPITRADRVHLLHQAVNEGKISLNRCVEMSSTAPAKIFGLYPRKGSLMAGSDAYVVVWDPRHPFESPHRNRHMLADYPHS